MKLQLLKVCVKNGTSEWIDDEVFGGIRAGDKLFRKFRKSRQHTNNVIYRRANLITNKKRNYITKKLTYLVLSWTTQHRGNVSLCISVGFCCH